MDQKGQFWTKHLYVMGLKSVWVCEGVWQFVRASLWNFPAPVLAFKYLTHWNQVKIGENSQECVRIVCNVCEGVCECVELRTPNVLAEPVSTLPQTPLDINETEEHIATCTYTSFFYKRVG